MSWLSVLVMTTSGAGLFDLWKSYSMTGANWTTRSSTRCCTCVCWMKKLMLQLGLSWCPLNKDFISCLVQSFVLSSASLRMEDKVDLCWMTSFEWSWQSQCHSCINWRLTRIRPSITKLNWLQKSKGRWLISHWRSRPSTRESRLLSPILIRTWRRWTNVSIVVVRNVSALKRPFMWQRGRLKSLRNNLVVNARWSRSCWLRLMWWRANFVIVMRRQGEQHKRTLSHCWEVLLFLVVYWRRITTVPTPITLLWLVLQLYLFHFLPSPTPTRRISLTQVWVMSHHLLLWKALWRIWTPFPFPHWFWIWMVLIASSWCVVNRLSVHLVVWRFIIHIPSVVL